MTRLLAALGLTLLLLLAACGGDDDDDSSDDAPNDATATVATDGDDGDGGDDEATDAPGDGDDGGEDDDGGDDDGGSAGGDAACSLLTEEELAAVVELEWAEIDDTGTTAETSHCTWENPDGTAAIYLEVQHEGGDDWFETIHGGNAGDDEFFGEVEPVEGLGDEAVWQDGLSVLDVVDGDKFVSVQVVVFEEEVDHLAVAKELAEIVLERI